MADEHDRWLELPIPQLADLPGDGWLALDEGAFDDFGTSGVAELIDCVGPDFPDDEVASTAASPHFVRPPRQIVHGLGVSFNSIEALAEAQAILASSGFAGCLGRAIGADFEAQEIATELLGMELAETDNGHRVTFTGGDEHGVQPVHLDIALIRAGLDLGVLWFGDTPEPFARREVTSVVDAITIRVG